MTATVEEPNLEPIVDGLDAQDPVTKISAVSVEARDGGLGPVEEKIDRLERENEFPLDFKV